MMKEYNGRLPFRQRHVVRTDLPYSKFPMTDSIKISFCRLYEKSYQHERLEWGDETLPSNNH